MCTRQRCHFSSVCPKLGQVQNGCWNPSSFPFWHNATISMRDQRLISLSWVSLFSTISNQSFHIFIPDQDSFLPSAIQRYHQLFVPSLQLIDGMLATLGTKHTTLVHQVLCIGSHCFFSRMFRLLFIGIRLFVEPQCYHRYPPEKRGGLRLPLSA